MSTIKTGRSPSLLQTLRTLLLKQEQRPDVDDPCLQSWARELKSYQDIPQVYRTFFQALPGELDPFPYTALTPTFRGIRGKPEHEKLVCITGDTIHVLERIGDGFLPASYPAGEISCLDTGVVLLYSWITIMACSRDGHAASSTLLFNSVTDHVMAPFIERIRCSSCASKDADTGSGRDRFMSLSDTNLKFANYAERTILRGETVIQVIYQPAIQLALGSLLGFSFSRRVSPAHLCILTDRELILLADDDSQTWLRGSPHGAIWRYIPLTKIRFASLVLDRGDLISLRLQLPGDVRLESVFSAAKKGDLEHLQRQLCPRA